MTVCYVRPLIAGNKPARMAARCRRIATEPKTRRAASKPKARGAASPKTAGLLDTNVISELRRVRPHGAVVAWLQTVPDHDLFLSAVTVGEVQAGIEIARGQDPAKAQEIEAWLDLVVGTYNILPMDAAAFRTWARLMHRQSNDLIEDAMIAATADIHDLTVVTRNSQDFALLGVRTFNPFGSGTAPS